MNFHRFKANLPKGMDIKILIAAAVCCFGIWSFIEIADDAPEGDYLQTEIKVLQALRNPDSPEDPVGPEWLENAAIELTALGSIPVLILFTSLVLIYLLLAGKKRIAFSVAFATILGGGLIFLLKEIFARERPDVVPSLVEVSTYSFPSSHAMAASMVFMTLGALLAQASTRRWERIYFIVAALALSVTIGLTRVYLGVHYPTDVMAGWAAGTSWALLWWIAAYWIKK